MPAVCRADEMLGTRLNGSALTVNGRTVADNMKRRGSRRRHPRDRKAIYAEGHRRLKAIRPARRGMTLRRRGAADSIAARRCVQRLNHMAAETRATTWT